MNIWFAKSAVLVMSVALVVIRAPHGQRSGSIPVAKSGKGTLETVLLTIAWIAFFLPLLWIVAPLFGFADYPLQRIPFVVGCVCAVVSLWLFHRSHVDLGTNWSISLEVREEHRLVTHGVYRWVRHPMYSALLLYGVGQVLVLPNWFVGPTYLTAMVLLIALRLRPEERMMVETFGAEYEDYRSRTKRLVPGCW